VVQIWSRNPLNFRSEADLEARAEHGFVRGVQEVDGHPVHVQLPLHPVSHVGSRLSTLDTGFTDVDTPKL